MLFRIARVLMLSGMLGAAVALCAAVSGLFSDGNYFGVEIKVFAAGIGWAGLSFIGMMTCLWWEMTERRG